jgi:hypothetical protein
MYRRECQVCGAEANEPCRDFCPVREDDEYVPAADPNNPSPWDA